MSKDLYYSIHRKLGRSSFSSIINCKLSTYFGPKKYICKPKLLFSHSYVNNFLMRTLQCNNVILVFSTSPEVSKIRKVFFLQIGQSFLLSMMLTFGQKSNYFGFSRSTKRILLCNAMYRNGEKIFKILICSRDQKIETTNSPIHEFIVLQNVF